MVFDAIDKNVHPTRYRQIGETQSLHALNDKEHRVLSEGQKDCSVVAKMHYQKRRSHEIAVKAHECLQKLQGTKGSEVDMEVNTRFVSSSMTSTATFEPGIECERSENTAQNRYPAPFKSLTKSGPSPSTVEIYDTRRLIF